MDFIAAQWKVTGKLDADFVATYRANQARGKTPRVSWMSPSGGSSRMQVAVGAEMPSDTLTRPY